MNAPFHFVDAHLHLWDLQQIRHPWLEPPFSDHGINGNVAAIADNYLLDDYLRDSKGWNMAGIVHVEAGADPVQALDETRWLEQHLNRCGLAFALVGFAALDAPDVETQLAAQCEFPHVRGIRQIVNWHQNPEWTYTPADLLQSPAWRHGFSCLRKYGLSFDLQLYPGQMAQAAKLAAQYPDIPIIINHAGMPVERGHDGVKTWKHGMRLLAAQPNISVKLSGFGLIDRQWTIDSIRALVLDSIDIFGVQRCMFASDFPTDKLRADFNRILLAYAEITSDFSDGERDQLFAANAARIYRMEMNPAQSRYPQKALIRPSGTFSRREKGESITRGITS